MMAVQKLQGKTGSRPLRAAQLSVAVLAIWSGVAVAQSNVPITGSMGSADTRYVTAPAPAPAQTAPVVQQMPAAGDAGQAQVAQTAPAAAPATQERRVPRDVVRRDTPLRVGEHARDGMLGDETEGLLALQASNLAAGPGLPMLGATASRAYKRYLDSFAYPIPQFYPTMIQSDSASGGGGGGGAAPPATGAGASQ
ncbi:DUF3613 domain-containing protein [Pandoraea apista]|nr:DUF3613 domain-containing protein [Pandoraea apista]RRW99750.1 DUF3613 domain-containing protein [Pandoraea apista]CFB64614.1 hypothetical protein LMG16407_04415 [Pandoraea apista]